MRKRPLRLAKAAGGITVSWVEVWSSRPGGQKGLGERKGRNTMPVPLPLSPPRYLVVLLGGILAGHLLGVFLAGILRLAGLFTGRV